MPQGNTAGIKKNACTHCLRKLLINRVTPCLVIALAGY